MTPGWTYVCVICISQKDKDKPFQNIRISPDRLWKPDILLYNSASADFYGAYQRCYSMYFQDLNVIYIIIFVEKKKSDHIIVFSSSLIVYSDGTVEQIPPGIFQSTCKVARSNSILISSMTDMIWFCLINIDNF